jgi:hypothetical protein
MRDKQLDGPPWNLDLKLSKLVLRAVLPRGKCLIHGCGESCGQDSAIIPPNRTPSAFFPFDCYKSLKEGDE